MMTSRFKWLTPILILSLLLMSVFPSVSCTPGEIVYLLIWSAIGCGIEVYLDGVQLGTLEYMEEWGACVFLDVTTVAMRELGFTIPGELLTKSALDRGIQLRADQISSIPDMTVTYKGVIAPDSRCEINMYYPQELITQFSMRLSGESEDQLDELGTIVVETSSEQFEPRQLINPSISCEPSSFIVMLQPDTEWSTTMRIGNQGSAALTYNLTDTDSLTEPIHTELIYDDGQAEYALSAEGSLERDAVRFTPISYPVNLKAARIRLWPNYPDSDHEQFAVEVYDDDGPGGAPGSLLGTVYDIATSWDWWDVDISVLGITIGSGDFYIAFCQLTGCPDCEVVSRDSDYPHYGRSWSKCEGCSSWVQHSDHNFMIRCVVEIPADCPWLDMTPKTGLVQPGDCRNITMTIDASGLAAGEYDAKVVIFSNDPEKNPIKVPLTLLVNRPPTALSNPTPPNQATNVHTDVDLSWTSGDPDVEDTVTYDVYFGTSANPPLKETIGPYPATQSSVSYDPGTLADGITYYWKIVTRDNHEIKRAGPVWEFTVGIEEIQLSLQAGWNMVSVPVVLAYNSTSAVFPGVAGIFAWNATGRSYYVPTVIEPERGYWVAVTEDTTISINGTPVDTWTTDIKAGWNMIGSVITIVSIAAPNDDPDDSAIPTAYWWNPDPVDRSYNLTTDIEPGKGYWVASVNDCVLIL